jgi:hypothetical protein
MLKLIVPAPAETACAAGDMFAFVCVSNGFGARKERATPAEVEEEGEERG